jgi:hypothetical protein
MKQFSLRDMLLFVAFVAIVLGWWIHRHNQATATSQYRLHTAGDRVTIEDPVTGKTWP